MEEGVGTAPFCPLARRVRDGVGVVSEPENRDRLALGVANSEDGVVDRRRRLCLEAPAGEEESVLPIGLEKESSGDEGPVKK